eukprot:snap_masked-scaffold_15-processed-gene-9.31-mRNA-1 protein AED:1.00 eAED:1.00 QI:0/0/0/0/1/1/9/0/788
MKLVSQQYAERKERKTFKINWKFEDGKPVDPIFFKAQIRSFIKGFKIDIEVVNLVFKNCPILFLESSFSKLILCFPAVKAIYFSKCFLSGENFKEFAKIDNLGLNISEFDTCFLPDSSSFGIFLRSANIKSLVLQNNLFNKEDYSNIFKSIALNKKLRKIKLTESKDSFSEHITELKNFLRVNTKIRVIELDVKFDNILENDIIEFKELINSHPSIIAMNAFRILFQPKIFPKHIAKLVHSSLQKQYEKYEELNEVSVILMGDGRTGKTSLLRNLSGKSFQKETQSTLVLEDIQIFEARKNNNNQSQRSMYELNALTKYELSVQRVKNMLSCKYNVEDEIKKISKYNLKFENELIRRVIEEKRFLEEYVNPRKESEFRSNNTFLRVYDFGGQEIFSSVHHIFMNKKAIYLVVFNMTKLKEKDLLRLRFWCESILTNAPKAPVLFIGTFLNIFLKKTIWGGLKIVNKTLKNFLLGLSQNLNIINSENMLFFPIENSQNTNLSQINIIKNHLLDVHFRSSNLGKLIKQRFAVKSVYVLFLDNCREEYSYMTVQKFKTRAKKCNFSEKELEEMLEIYSKEGIISYFKDINLSESENFIFFAPSFLAQALGSFIRDESFHQLAFRTNKKVFSNYRKYIDIGIIRKDLFEVLLQQYTKKERQYVLNLALHSLVLFTDPREKNAFIVPELLPEVKDSKLKISWKADFVVKVKNSITKEKFMDVVFIFLKYKRLQESFLFMFFARFIFGPNEVIDIFPVSKHKYGFDFHGNKRIEFWYTIVPQLVEDIKHCDLEV